MIYNGRIGDENMVSEKSKEEYQKSILKSFEEIKKIVKMIGEENRLRILTYLLTEPLTFQAITEKTKLGRTALSNHLNKLKEAGLVEKPHHGLYEITKTAEGFLEAIENAYSETEENKKTEEERMQRYQLSESFLKRKRK